MTNLNVGTDLTAKVFGLQLQENKIPSDARKVIEATQTVMLVLNHMGSSFREWLWEEHKDKYKKPDFFRVSQNKQKGRLINPSYSEKLSLYRIQIYGYEISNWVEIVGKLPNQSGKLVNKNQVIIRLKKSNDPKARCLKLGHIKQQVMIYVNPLPNESEEICISAKKFDPNSPFNPSQHPNECVLKVTQEEIFY
jgi:hypothetical protein